MVLEELHDLIETLQKRIAEHGSALQQSEALTRYALIDPLLRGLGWDTGDPSQVFPEFPVPRKTKGNTYADYALIGPDRKPAIIVEAKSLNSSLDDAAEQALSYCIVNGYDHFVVTDGQRWHLYETFRKGPLDESIVVELDLEAPPAKTVLAALALWRPAAVEGSLQPAPEPVVTIPPPPPPTPAPDPDPTPTSSQPPTLSADWIGLPKLGDVKGKKPKLVQMSDGSTHEIASWGAMLRHAVEWLAQHGDLSSANLPVQMPSGSRYVVATRPQHKSGKPFIHGRPVAGVHVEFNWTATQTVTATTAVLQHAGQDPAQFHVTLKS